MMDAEVSTHSWQWLLRNLPIFACNILMWYTRNIYIFFSSTEQSRAYHLHYCRDDRIICCQIFYDLLLKSAFERIFNVMQLILVKIKWHVKWKYLIQKFHNICLSYYFKLLQSPPGAFGYLTNIIESLCQYEFYKVKVNG